MSTRAGSDVVVVGAGVMGAFVALRAQQAGRATTLVDAWPPGHPRATSGADTRILIASSMGDEYYARMAYRARDDWRELEAELGETLFVEAGAVIFLGPEDSGFIERRQVVMAEVGIPFEVLTPADVRERWPQVGVDDLAAAAFEPQSGVVRARRGVEAAVKEFVRLGGRLELGSILPPALTAGEPGEELVEVVDQTGRRFQGDTFVFACGPWLPRMFPDLLGDRIEVTKQDVCFFGPRGGIGDYELGPLPAYIDHPFGYDGVPGFGPHGLKAQPERRGPAWDPTHGDRIPDADSIRLAKEFVAARFPGLAGQPVSEAQVCQGERTPDLDWIIDRHPAHDNVWIVGGGSSHGYKHGPQIGRYVVSRLDGAPGDDEGRFSLDRFADQRVAAAITPRDIA